MPTCDCEDETLPTYIYRTQPPLFAQWPSAASHARAHVRNVQRCTCIVLRDGFGLSLSGSGFAGTKRWCRRLLRRSPPPTPQTLAGKRILPEEGRPQHDGESWSSRPWPKHAGTGVVGGMCPRVSMQRAAATPLGPLACDGGALQVHAPSNMPFTRHRPYFETPPPAPT